MKQKMANRSFWGIAIVFTLLFGMVVLSGCIGQDDEGDFDAKVAIVFGTGGLGDKSFNDAAYRGLQKAQDEYNVKGDYVEPFEIADFEGYLKDYAEDGSYDLILSIGFDQADAINATAMQYPDQKFVIIDMVVFPAIAENNIRSIVFKEEEGSALVGAVAGFLTETDKIGFVGGMDIELIQKFLVGYEFGAQYVNPDVEVVSSFVGHWFDVPLGKTITEQQLADGADVIYSAAGRSGLGAIEAVDETSDKYSIGVDQDQCDLSSRMAATMLKKVDEAVSMSIADVIEGNWSVGVIVLGIAENGIGICEHLDRFLSASQIAEIEALKEAIAAGTVVVPVPP